MPVPYRGSTGGPSLGVGFVEALKFFFTRYAQFTGRSPRSEYWWPVLFFVVTTLALTLLGLSLGTQPTSGTRDAPTLNDFEILILLVLAVMILGTIVPCIAVAVRRLHYAGLPGWFYLVIFLPYVGNVALIGIGLLPRSLRARASTGDTPRIGHGPSILTGRRPVVFWGIGVAKSHTLVN